MRNKKRHFPSGKFSKSAKHFEFAARVESGGRFIQNQQLRVAQISPRQSDFLPLAAGKIHSLLEAAAPHLLVGPGQAANNLFGHALARCDPQEIKIVDLLDAANRYVFTSGHFITHEILEDDADLTMQILQVVLAKIDSIEQDLPLSGIVQPGHQLDDGGLALAIFANQGQPLRGMQLKINAIENQSGISGIAERDVAKLDSLHDGSRRRQCVRLGANGCLHFKEGQQIGEKQRLVTNGRQGGENLLNVAAGLLNRSCQEYQLADRQRTGNRTPNYKYVGRIVTRGSNYRE